MILPHWLLLNWTWHFIANVHQLTESDFFISASLSFVIYLFVVVVVVVVGDGIVVVVVVPVVVSLSVVSFLLLSLLLRWFVGWCWNLNNKIEMVKDLYSVTIDFTSKTLSESDSK